MDLAGMGLGGWSCRKLYAKVGKNRSDPAPHPGEDRELVALNNKRIRPRVAG